MKINRLPFDVIYQILQEILNQSDKAHGSTLSDLIRLRSISKEWSEAALIMYFQTISINDSQRAKTILNNWTEDFFGARDCSPVQALTIRRIFYAKEEDEEKEEGRKELRKGVEQSTSVSIDQVSRLIGVLGTNLKTLNLKFINSFGVSTDLINSIKTIKDLKSLNILYESQYAEFGTYDFNSISDLFSVIPKLENLTIHVGELLEYLILKHPALSNLRYLSVTYDKNLGGICNISECSRDTLKIVQLYSANEELEGLYPFFEPIKDTLEGLFTISFNDQLQEDVTNLSFPNLRVIGTQSCPGRFVRGIDWFNVPMLQNVRTIVTDLFLGEESWLRALRVAGGNAFKKVPNVKHIVFVKNEAEPNGRIHPKLVKFFESHGVKCHVTNELTCNQIMKLDYQLNGPMN